MNPLPASLCACCALLFFAPPRHQPGAAPFSDLRKEFADRYSAGARGYVMARINRLLRSAPARIGQRIAQFVALAAASLPDAGA
jgi:hypothetical protein